MLQSKDCFSFSASRGSARHFFILLFLVTKRAARFRRVALKKLLSVFAEQLSCLPWHIYIIPHSFAKINTILSKFVQIRPHLSKFVQPALETLYSKASSHFRQKAIRLAQNPLLHVAHRRARCLLIRTIGEIGQCRQCIALIIIFRHKPLCKLFDVRPESILHNCCSELVGKEDELPLTDNQESNALLQRIATCSTAELHFFVDQLPVLRQFKPKR